MLQIIYSLKYRTAARPHFVGAAYIGEPIERNGSATITLERITEGEDTETVLIQLREAYGIDAETPADRYSRKAVRNMTTGQVFENAAEAARHHDISPSTLSLHLNNPGKHETAGGYVFKRV